MQVSASTGSGQVGGGQMQVSFMATPTHPTLATAPPSVHAVAPHSPRTAAVPQTAHATQAAGAAGGGGGGASAGAADEVRVREWGAAGGGVGGGGWQLLDSSIGGGGAGRGSGLDGEAVGQVLGGGEEAMGDEVQRRYRHGEEQRGEEGQVQFDRESSGMEAMDGVDGALEALPYAHTHLPEVALGAGAGWRLGGSGGLGEEEDLLGGASRSSRSRRETCRLEEHSLASDAEKDEHSPPTPLRSLAHQSPDMDSHEMRPSTPPKGMSSRRPVMGRMSFAEHLQAAAFMAGDEYDHLDEFAQEPVAPNCNGEKRSSNTHAASNTTPNVIGNVNGHCVDEAAVDDTAPVTAVSSQVDEERGAQRVEIAEQNGSSNGQDGSNKETVEKASSKKKKKHK